MATNVDELDITTCLVFGTITPASSLTDHAHGLTQATRRGKVRPQTNAVRRI